MQVYEVDMRPNILLIDGAHALRRSMYAQNLRELSNSQGMPTGAIFGFLNIIKSAINSMSASSLVVAWEGGHSARRLQVYDKYKYRDYDEEPERDIHGYTDYEYYSHQLSWVQKLLESLGIHQLKVEGKEGDDVLFQASKLINGRKIIISEDRDFYSLVSEDTSIYRPIKKEFIDLENFQESSGGYPSPTHYLYGKVLLGDGSDNIPSVAKGAGEKTILDVLTRIEKPEDVNPKSILAEAAKLGGFRHMKLVDAGEAPIIRNLDLIDISREKFDVFQLQSIADNLSTHIYPNFAIADKLFRVLEFSDENTRGLKSKIASMSEFSLNNFINKDYIKNVMMGLE